MILFEDDLIRFLKEEMLNVSNGMAERMQAAQMLANLLASKY